MADEPDDDRQPSEDVAVGLLGGFLARVDGEPIPASSWRLRKGRELVKLLALAPHHRLHREQLTEVLWPELDPEAAANNLNQVVHVARRALGAKTISLREELLTLRARVDVDEFERAAAQARRSGSSGAYRAAMSLYTGELLPENRYEDWARERREQLEQLHGELDAESASLSVGRPASGLPAQASSFVGRKHELHELQLLLRRTRMLTLAGPGGAGKTRLAIEVAHAAEREFADGAVLVELADVGDEQLVLGAMAAVLEVAALPGRPLLEGLTDFVAPRSMLLVLDNCEHVLRTSAMLSDALLRAAPGLTVLATSREPLRVAGEVVFRVPSMTIPDPEQALTPAALLGYESAGLFDARARAAVPDFEITAENSADVARICFRLDGLPLALELAAARLDALGTATLAERLDDRFRLLRTGSRAGPTRQQTLAATLQWSHELLDEPEQLLFRRLSTFAGGFDLRAVELVCTGDGLAEDDVADLLARLVEKSLVSVESAARELRYRLLDTVRLYARERLAETAEAGPLAARHAAWAWAMVEREGDSPRLDREEANLRAAHDVLLAGEPTDALAYCVALTPFWLRRIDLEEGHRRLLLTLEAAPRRTAQRAAALLSASAIDLRAGSIACSMQHAEESHEIAREIDEERGQWQALQRLGELAVSNDRGTEAITRFELALEIARSEGFRAFEAVSGYSLGVARWLSGDLAGTEEMLSESSRSFAALADSDERIPSLLNIAETRAADPAMRPSLRIVFEETLHPLVASSCSAALGYVLANQATVARLRGEPERALALLEEAGERFTRMDDPRGRADVLVRRAYLALNRGLADAAPEHLEQALALRTEMRDRRGVGMTLASLGLVETVRGNFEAAERPLAEARDIFRRAGDRWGLASALWRSADLAIARGRLGDAEAALEEARAVVGATARESWIAVTAAALAEVAVLRGDTPRALVLFEQAREHYLATGEKPGAEAMRVRVRTLAKNLQTPRKGRAATTAPTVTKKRRQS